MDSMRMMSMLAVSSKQAALHARNALVEAGFLEVQRGKRSCPNQYRLRSVYDVENRSENETENETVSISQNVPHKHK